VVTHHFILPHKSLSPFVNRYYLSKSDTINISFTSDWYASNETSLVYYLGDKPGLDKNLEVESYRTGSRDWLVGILSKYSGIVTFHGHYNIFAIQFRANGFSKLFGLPVSEFTNRIFPTIDVFGKNAGNLYEQLVNTTDIQQMAVFADKFLLRYLNKQRAIEINDGITRISNEFFVNKEVLDISEYAYHANMSLRNFERRFSEQVGVAPKLFCRLLRFNNTINYKISHPELKWTSIAHEMGYYDQVHMINDFKHFANCTPLVFSQNNLSSFKDKFVSVKRALF
jgi:AraC-like DNA-binding protein